jgi:putative lipoprotein
MTRPVRGVLQRMLGALLALVAAALLAQAPAAAETKVLRGTLAYRERIALPPNAVAEVSLVDSSRADAAANVIGRTQISPAGQPPIAWEIGYDSNAITSRGKYALQARISVDGRLWFVTATRNPVLTGGPDKTNLMLRAVPRNKDEQPVRATYQGRWLAEDIGGGGVIDRLQTTLEIGDDNRIAGKGGCNRYFGRAKVAGETMSFSEIGATQMACTPAAMDQESKFFAALGETRGWRYDALRRKLTLVDGTGRAVVVFARL